MADGVLSFPFRLTTTGAIATVAYGSDAFVDEAIAKLALTNIGERPMAPDYGVPDPTFAALHIGDVQAGLTAFGPTGVRVTSVEMQPFSDTQSVASIAWAYEDALGDTNNG
ncbi:baseplate wedge protein [Arthrobacter phage JKerns]|uniref:Baseplate wedge protein n=4 Tax=Marthavirus TaxID=1980936 RepID=A0A0U4INW1_9CAUD|nr:baseplate protein [Arthrobacter phage Sonny]YP_009612483.1 baseplate protein [Arthrobacter phage Shade]YP_009884251.1 baseplate protein [Arthrobacter phage Zartrosa]ASR80583.1 baseplate wedge protein [Arthrobacter phage Jordan]QIQ62842.1 baseplate wedge protein [Arthrobacter phage JKerns]ALY10298.1 baseplate wedge protein [Arthrobacter phage Sonny]ASR80735.1 baseplate wedge protein [Arthrobacter phage Shade]QED11142.1 baseplate wedge protein [Arthrobacter phage Zartrosa]